ncbi:MAG: inosine monophosphate cyclohydrolase [Chloroflexota bacterium]|nr:inosine monophosphate cyclohydrolase [Chloroflexota bacterium]
MTTQIDELHVYAEQNFGRHLLANSYPGRGIVVGRLESDPDEDLWVQVYWIMGRSENSRNRRFVVGGANDNELRTEARDPALVSDPTNIIYDAMLESPDLYYVSNGDHTHTIKDAIERSARLEDALAVREREDDAPNYTPRIAAMLDLRGLGELSFAILRANAANHDETDRIVWRFPFPPPGLGYGITTYRHDGNPLPAFAGDPLWLPLTGSPEDVADTYWNALDHDNKIALAVKAILDGASRIILRQH